MGSKEQAERLEILVTEKDKEIAALRKENAELREKGKKRGKRLNERVLDGIRGLR